MIVRYYHVTSSLGYLELLVDLEGVIERRSLLFRSRKLGLFEDVSKVDLVCCSGPASLT